MKEINIKIKNISSKQWSNFVIELNLMKEAWRRFGPIIDIKTTSDKSLSSFKSSAYKYGYHRQAAFYLDGFQAKEFIFVVIEKKAPYNVGVYIAGEDFINRGRSEYFELLTIYNDYFLSSNKKINTYIEKGEL